MACLKIQPAGGTDCCWNACSSMQARWVEVRPGCRTPSALFAARRSTSSSSLPCIPAGKPRAGGAVRARSLLQGADVGVPSGDAANDLDDRAEGIAARLRFAPHMPGRTLVNPVAFV